MPETCFLRSRLFERHGLHGIVNLRTGGVSPAPFDSMNLAPDTGDDVANVQRNLDLLLHEAGIAGEPHRARQVHGRAVLPCSGEGMTHPTEADILISRDGSPLGVRVADCTPVLIADPEKGLLAAVHAGWRGTAMDAAGHGVQALVAMGGRPESMIASIGPCIGLCCFEIGEDTAAALRNCTPGADSFIDRKDGRPHADLAGINRLQLLRTGLGDQNIERMPGSDCTCCHSEHFFSYRRDGARSGRHLAIVATRQHA